MKSKYSLAVTALGLGLLAGCNNGEIPVDSAQLKAPVNVATVTIVRHDTQDAASDALGRIGTPAVPALVESLTNLDPAVRMEACRALAYMGAKAKDAVPPLTRTLHDQEEMVRDEAARALGQIGDSAQMAVPDLIQMMQGKK